MAALITFQDVCRYYPMGDSTVVAADHISFSIESGEFTAIVVAEKIRRLKKEIQGMMSRDPFLYGVWIGDPEQVREKQEEYRRLIQGWKESRKQFAKKLETLLLERRNPGCPMN